MFALKCDDFRYALKKMLVLKKLSLKSPRQNINKIKGKR